MVPRGKTARPIPGLNKSPLWFACVYALCDPDTHAIRYIGATQYLRIRYWQHINRPSGLRNPAFTRWVELIKAAGKLPLCKILEKDGSLRRNTH